MQNPKTAAARLKKISSLRPTLAIVPGRGFQAAQFEQIHRLRNHGVRNS
ncbi:MAG TPA: hypothetical protein VGH42_01945 [Verrucomicrobiae bacterium]|jgi:hypothetical protein